MKGGSRVFPRSRPLGLVAVATLALTVSCAAPVSVGVSAREPEVPVLGRVELTARVENPSPELRYRWRADSGRCDPQESSLPSTTYLAAGEPGEDRVKVEVMRGGRIVATAETLIRVTPARQATPVGPATPGDTGPLIRITTVPHYDPMGGPATAADISGFVTGVTPAEYRVVLYVKTDMWYVQPLVASSLTGIAADGKWSTWIHTGTLYAALLVRAGYVPDATRADLPAVAVGGDIVAVAVVEGRR